MALQQGVQQGFVIQNQVTRILIGKQLHQARKGGKFVYVKTFVTTD